uniref:Proteasome subunit beta n=2 Tax=Norrisiella sphaerica TaxID=552664 RepID=A0A7S2QRW9_9EUKA|eukprot:CAMPEP_0184487738 /NCGR_PEP_ID=MMETSP0113_2-20130426/10306_1 /TAXON_ID=91329 /ORGANISM="Norrisiella sphaerica, Strain BC52" /LENGTH=231 /DNA_ID=CAMNT_0026870135 /DNA_START=56 /DNA_END=751 /DNA_ORIENTATION=-
MSILLKATPKEGVKEQRQWSPYIDNGGTVLGVAPPGADFVVLAGDTRMSYGYSIASRNVTKIVKLTEKCVLASAGMQAERHTLHKVLSAKATMFENTHHKKMSAPSMAQCLSNTLYYKRFFPYYTFNVLAGLDEKGLGAVWGYDAIGSFERVPYVVTGSGSALATSILDNQVLFKTQPKNKRELKCAEVVELVKDVFTCISERDIYTGDSAEIYVITKDGCKKEIFPLKKD